MKENQPDWNKNGTDLPVSDRLSTASEDLSAGSEAVSSPEKIPGKAEGNPPSEDAALNRTAASPSDAIVEKVEKTEGNPPSEGVIAAGENAPWNVGKPDAPAQSDLSAESSARVKNKKRAATFLITIGVLFALLLGLNCIDFDAIAERLNARGEQEATETVKTYPPTYFAIPDYDADITADSDYMKLDRSIHYTADGETEQLFFDTAEADPNKNFWKLYFSAVADGDSAAIDRLCSAEYLKENSKTARFAPQKIFNIKVVLSRREELDEGDANGNFKGYTVSYYTVSYQIKDNNGTFRNDFFEDFYTVPLIFELLDNGSTVELNSIHRIRSGDSETDPNQGGFSFMFVVWILLIAIALIVEMLTTSLVAVWFIPAGIVSLILSLVLPDSLVLQIALYPVVALILLILTRPFVKKRLQKGKYQPTNADRIIGMTGIVTEAVDNIREVGEVKVAGGRWSARSENGEAIELGCEVEILSIQGVKVIVRKKAVG